MLLSKVQRKVRMDVTTFSQRVAWRVRDQMLIMTGTQGRVVVGVGIGSPQVGQGCESFTTNLIKVLSTVFCDFGFSVCKLLCLFIARYVAIFSELLNGPQY